MTKYKDEKKLLELFIFIKRSKHNI